MLVLSVRTIDVPRSVFIDFSNENGEDCSTIRAQWAYSTCMGRIFVTDGGGGKHPRPCIWNFAPKQEYRNLSYGSLNYTILPCVLRAQHLIVYVMVHANVLNRLSRTSLKDRHDYKEWNLISTIN